MFLQGSLLVTALLCCGLAASAQTIPVEATPILYRQGVPIPAIRLMPRDAKSLFWGTFSDGKNSARKAIHLFAIDPKTQFANDRKKREFNGYHLTLDLFEQRNQNWTRFNRVPVGYCSAIWGPLLISANFVWIDQPRRVPLLSFRCFADDEHGADIPYGDAIFLSFAGGWSSRPTLQRAEYGFSNSGSNHYIYRRTGAEPLKIENNGGSMNIGKDENGDEIMALTYFCWNNDKRKFVVTPESVPLLGNSMAQWRP